MKKFVYLIILLLVLHWPAFSQTTVINENFETDLIDWQFEGNWFHEPGYIFMYYHPITYDYDFWVISPEFDVPASGGDLIINHFIDVYMTNVTDEKCEISIIHNGEEDVVWEYALTEGAWGSIFGTDMLIPLDEFVGETVQLKMRSYGAKSNALWGWFIFNVNLTTFFDHDLAAIQLTGPGSLNPNQTGTWLLNVKNLGLNPASDFSLKLFSYKENEELASATYSGTIQPGNSADVPVNWNSDMIHNSVLYAVIDHTADQYSKNNASKGQFVRISPPQDFNVMLWDNDNGIATIANPETGVLEQPNMGIEKALQAAGIQYSKFSNLPADLGQYDVILVTMGCYCLS
ncbi:MAG: hypothetical protein IH598_02970 [Bacteroidales bacterium]|nr:hypothetical protein [Bacteroidales bacterium]